MIEWNDLVGPLATLITGAVTYILVVTLQNKQDNAVLKTEVATIRREVEEIKESVDDIRRDIKEEFANVRQRFDLFTATEINLLKGLNGNK